MEREPGCGDNSCVFSPIRKSGGMRTNGGCRCFENLKLNTQILNVMKLFDATQPDLVPYNNREEVEHIRCSVRMLLKAYRELEQKNKELEECLKWYVKEDDTNMGNPHNEPWAEGKKRAMKALGMEDAD
jgi:hypothetical protein